MSSSSSGRKRIPIGSVSSSSRAPHYAHNQNYEERNSRQCSEYNSNNSARVHSIKAFEFKRESMYCIQCPPSCSGTEFP